MGLFKKKRISLFARFLFIFLQIISLLSFRNSIFFLLSNTITMQNYQKKHLYTLYMVFVLSFILEFIGLFVTLFRSFSLTNINIPFIENSTILKHFFAFFVSFFTQNITHFIFHFIKLSQRKKAKTQPFWAAIDGELRGKRSGNKRRKELFLSVFRGRKRKRRGVFF